MEEFLRRLSSEERSRAASQIAETGRSIWRTVNGGHGEAVWSPDLEATLVEGLERYHANGNKADRYGKFPKRNRFISDYILNKTGKKRSTKQISSRIQQLQKTCKGEKVARLLSQKSKMLAQDSNDLALPHVNRPSLSLEPDLTNAAPIVTDPSVMRLPTHHKNNAEQFGNVTDSTQAVVRLVRHPYLTPEPNRRFHTTHGPHHIMDTSLMNIGHPEQYDYLP